MSEAEGRPWYEELRELRIETELHPGSRTAIVEAMQGAKAAVDEFVVAAGRTVILLTEEEEWQQIGMSPKDAQFVESREFRVAEVLSAFKIDLPPSVGFWYWQRQMEQGWRAFEEVELVYLDLAAPRWRARWAVAALVAVMVAIIIVLSL